MSWNKAKIILSRRQYDGKHLREGEIRWLACGENIGTEINGKGKDYARPVLVLKKLDKRSFIGIPMTTRQKDGSWYIKVNFQGKEVRAVIAQIRLFSSSRVYKRIGRLDENDMAKIKKGLRSLLTL